MILSVFHRPRATLACATASLLVSGLAVLDRAPLGPTLVPPLEARFTRASIPHGRHIDGIIVLGGSIDRTVEGVELARRYPTAKLVITGFKEEEAHAYALRHGIGDRLVLETKSRTTYENALLTARLLAPARGQHWIIVTDAWHMPRSVGAFRAAGFTVLPWPIRSAPDSARLTAGIARHEWLGLIAYRLLGRSDSLFPAPAPREST